MARMKRSNEDDTTPMVEFETQYKQFSLIPDLPGKTIYRYTKTFLDTHKDTLSPLEKGQVLKAYYQPMEQCSV